MKYSTQISNGRPFDEESIIVLLIRDGKCFIQLKELRPVVEGYWKIDGVDIQFGKMVNNFIAYKKNLLVINQNQISANKIFNKS